MRTKVLAKTDHDIFVLTGYTVSPTILDTYFLGNRVENQKLNQTTAELPFGRVFGFSLGLQQTQLLINTMHLIISWRLSCSILYDIMT